MNTYTVTTKSLLDQKMAHFVFFLHENFTTKSISKELKQFIEAHSPDLFLLFEKKKFTGKVGDQLIIPVQVNRTIKYCIFVGIGSDDVAWPRKLEHYRRAIGTAVRIADAHGCACIGFSLLSTKWIGLTVAELMQQTVTTVDMATYTFDEYISKKPDADENKVCDVTVCVANGDEKEAKAGLAAGEIISQNV